MKKISIRYLSLGNIFGYFAKSLAIIFMVALIGCTSSSTDDSDDNTPPQEQPSNPDDGDDNSGGGSGASDNNEQISMEELVANVESAQEVIDPLFEQCETIDDLAKHLDEIKAMECVSEVEIEEETLFIILKGGLRIGWSYHEFPLDSAEDDENGEEYSSYTPATSATSSQTDVVTRAEQRDEHKYISDVKNIAIINLTGSQNAYESALRKMIKEYTNLRIISNTDTTEEVINTINSSHIIWLMTHGMLTSSKHWFLTEYVFNIPEDISKNYHEIDDEFYLNDYYSYRKSKNSHTMWEKYVSETYLQKVLRLQNDAIVFCGACYSLKNNDNIATIFKNAGAIAYLGYDDGNAVGYYGGGCFIENLLRGQTINEAYQNKNMNDFKEDHWWNGGGSLLLRTRSSGGDYCIVHPKVKTIEKPEVEGTSATLEGVIEEWNGNKLLEGEVGFCWSKSKNCKEPTIENDFTDVLSISNSDQENIEFNTTIEDLEIATEYSYRAYLLINDEYFYGEVKSFKTDTSPYVKTLDAEVKDYEVKLKAEVVNWHTDYDGYVGFCWSKDNTNPTINDKKHLIDISAYDYTNLIASATIPDLDYNTTYYYRAFLKIKDEYLYGEVKTFIIEDPEAYFKDYLIKLYNDTNGDNWDFNYNWCSDKPLTSWAHISKNSNGSYSLNLRDDNLSGSIDLSGCITPFSLDINSDSINSINLSGCVNLKRLDCSYCNNLSELTISGCTALKELDCSYSNLKKLDVSNCTALQRLTSTNVGNPWCLTSINASGCSALEYLSCHDNVLTTLNLSGCIALKAIGCSGNLFSSLDFSGCTALESINCMMNWDENYNRTLKSINLEGCTSLKKLQCSMNALSNLNLSSCSKLEELDCSSNKITAQITEQLHNLKYFDYDHLYNYLIGYWTKNDDGWYYPGEPSERGHRPPESWTK